MMTIKFFLSYFGGLFTALIVIVAIDFFKFIKKYNKFKKSLCYKTTGKIIDIQEEKQSGLNNWIYNFYAVVSYKVNGKERYTKITQSISSAISSPFTIIAIKHAEVKAKAMIGREIDILLDVETLEVFSVGIYKGRIKNEILNFLITILNVCIIFIGALIIIFGIGFLI